MPENEELVIHYLKSPNFDTKYVTGAIGGPTVTGMINMDFFIDRVVIPQKVKHKILDGSKLGESKEVIQKEGIIREVNNGVIMDINVAKQIVTWLNDQIKKVEELKQEIDKI